MGEISGWQEKSTEDKTYETEFQERTFVVPQLLPEKKPREVSHYREEELDLRFSKESISFQFLPAVFIQQFIVKAARFSKVEHMWQQGILLKWENHPALVEADYKLKQIHIYANDLFLIETIKEEIESISQEGKTTARKMGKDNDIFHKNEKYLSGLAGLGKNDLTRISHLIAAGKIEQAISATKELYIHLKDWDSAIINLSQRFQDLSQKNRMD